MRLFVVLITGLSLAASCAQRVVSPPLPPADNSQANPSAQGQPPSKHASEPQAPPGMVTLIAGGDVTLGYHYEEYFDEQVRQGRSRQEMFAYGFTRLNELT